MYIYNAILYISSIYNINFNHNLESFAAQAFNKFYHECQINVEDENIKYTRANIVIITKSILKDALSLLGIQCPEQM